jgi:hypothetical protein
MTDQDMDDLFGAGGLEGWMASFDDKKTNGTTGHENLPRSSNIGLLEAIALKKSYPCDSTVDQLFQGQVRAPGDSKPMCRTTSKSPKTADVDYALNDLVLHHGKKCGGDRKLKKCDEQPVNIKWRERGCAVIGAQVRNGARYACKDVPLYYFGIMEECTKDYKFKEEWDIGGGESNYTTGWEGRTEGWQLINNVGDWGILWIKNNCNYDGAEFLTLKTPPPQEA